MRQLTWLGNSILAATLLVSQTAMGNELLIAAARDGDISRMRSLLEQNDADVNAARGDGSTALAWAVYSNDADAVELLIREGADVDAANDYHAVTPLSLACSNANPDILVMLLEAGADPNKAQASGETPLMTCANTGAVAGVEALLEHGADVNAREHKEEQTALMWAAAEKHPRIVKLLVDHGADVDLHSKVFQEPEPYVIEQERSENIWPTTYPDTVRFPEVSGGFTALHFAAQQGDVESARSLLEAGADVNAAHPEHGSPLIIGIASGHTELPLFLLESGADPNIKDAWGVAPLHYALHKGLLIMNGWSPTETEHLGWQREDMPELVQALLDFGADPNARVEHTFAFLDNPLLRSTDDPPQISPVGATPLLLAAAAGDTESMQILEEASDVTATTIGGATLFLLAAGGGVEKGARSGEDAVAAAKLAMEMGGGSIHDRLTNRVWGGPRRGTLDNRTALHFATYLGWEDMIKFLVENGADINAEDRYGMTPLMIALGDPEGRYYRQVGNGNYDLRMRRPGPTPGTGDQPEVAQLLLGLGAEPFTGEYRDSSGL